MRNPLRTEAEAFSFVLVVVALAAVVGIAVWLGGPTVGFLVFLALGVGIGVGLFLKSDPKVTEPAVWDRHRPDGVNRSRVARRSPGLRPRRSSAGPRRASEVSSSRPR
jgi:hypothetical protein